MRSPSRSAMVGWLGVAALVVAAIGLHLLFCEWNGKGPTLVTLRERPGQFMYYTEAPPSGLWISARFGTLSGIVCGLVGPAVMGLAAMAAALSGSRDSSKQR